MGACCKAKTEVVIEMKNHKSYFTKQDYERAFKSGSFRNDDFVAKTFSEIFSNYPPENLVHMTGTQLDKLVGRIKHSKRVMDMQQIIAEERKEGEASLNALADILFAQLQKLGIAPQNKDKIYSKRYGEWWAYCRTDMDNKKTGIIFEPSMPIAKGLFHASSMPLEKIVFAPENTFYSDLPFLFRNGELECEHGADVILKRVATVHVYRNKASDAELGDKVKAVLQNTADRLYGSRIKSPQKRYEAAESDIVNRLYSMFKSLKTGEKINYREL